eukprot:TRINITY_DN10906_c0_g1_i1.p1 TRINITY_DN10906_c0_g1~~TRINITY_DN10906_c0_g1_i1.p1  ORF type:complete len:269 (+),score=119.49 TRINITY_DN10906_c0_g1_i1:81-887(+)
MAHVAQTLDPAESATYFDEVDAPVLFEKMASELLRERPIKSEMMEMLVGLLLREKKRVSMKEDENTRSSRLFEQLAEGKAEVSWENLLSKLQVSESCVAALLPHLHANDEGMVTNAEWCTWLCSVENLFNVLEWVEQQLLLSPVLGWNADLERRVGRTFDLIDAQFDRNGVVDRDELIKALSKFSLTAKVLFKELDCNSDGGVSIAEWTNWFKKVCMEKGSEIAADRLEWVEECLDENPLTALEDNLRDRSAQVSADLQALADKLAAS